MIERLNLAARHASEALRALLNRKYRAEGDGTIVIPEMGLRIGGAFEFTGADGIPHIAPNMVVAEGLAHLGAVGLAQGSQKSAFYLGLFGGNVTVQSTWTGANVAANATEFNNYAETTRRLWDKAQTGATIGNAATPAVFTIGTGGGTVRGAFLAESAAKGGNTGVLIAAARLPSDKVMDANEELRVRYSIAFTSA